MIFSIIIFNNISCLVKIVGVAQNPSCSFWSGGGGEDRTFRDIMKRIMNSKEFERER